MAAAAASTSTPEWTGTKNLIRLVSKDGQKFDVEEAVAMQSQTIARMIQDGCTGKPIPLPDVSSAALQSVIDYCTMHAGDKKVRPDEEELKAWDSALVKVELGALFEIMLAARYLCIKGLLELTCQAAGHYVIKGMSPVEETPAAKTVYASASKFEDLNLSKELLNGLYAEMGFQKPSKIQALVLPMILTPPYKDLVALGHTGYGKTTCFVLGMLSRVDPNKNFPQALCICPTRELAVQNQIVLQRMGRFTGITSTCAIPTRPRNGSPSSWQDSVTEQVVIGTPGIIRRWMNFKKLAIRDIKILVFDEADHLLSEAGFKGDTDRIMREIHSSGSCQVLVFSATLDETLKVFVSKFVKDGNQICVKEDFSKVKQFNVQCPEGLTKIEVVRDRILEFGQNIGQVIIFVRTRQSSEDLHDELTRKGYKCTSIQGAMEQGDRDKIIEEFKKGCKKVLITTDLLARLFDQAEVKVVINYDLPIKHGTLEPDYEVYLHRVGRAGRFGPNGVVFNLLCQDWDKTIMEEIENSFGHKIPKISGWRSKAEFGDALKEGGLLLSQQPLWH